MRAEIFLPKNGDEYTISFCHPRKQLKEVRIPSLEKGLLEHDSIPGKEELKELWAYLLGVERKTSTSRLWRSSAASNGSGSSDPTLI